jgi:hypothetical protein
MLKKLIPRHSSSQKGQNFGNAAKKHTSKLVAGKTVDVEPYDADRYGRAIGVVFADGVNVNQSLIGAGLAWQYQKYCEASFCGDCKKQKGTTDTAALHGIHGNIKSHVFHSSSCRDYNCKGCVTVFHSREDAIAAGYRPCKQCKP